MADTLHSKIVAAVDSFCAATEPWSSHVIEHPECDGPELIDVISSHLTHLDNLARGQDREQQLIDALWEWRRAVETGPAGGQVRVKISSILNTIYGEGTAPKGVFDD